MSELFLSVEFNGFPFDLSFPSASDLTVKKLRETLRIGAHEVLVLNEDFLVETDQDLIGLKDGDRLKAVSKNAIKNKKTASSFFKASARKPITPQLSKKKEDEVPTSTNHLFEVVDFKELSSASGKKKFMTFRINFKQSDGTTLTLLKRYKQVENLHAGLSTKFKGLPKLPPKKGLLEKETPEFLQKRKGLLDIYLKKLEQVPNVFADDAMKYFLSDDSIGTETQKDAEFKELKKQEEKILGLPEVEQEVQKNKERRRSVRQDTLKRSLSIQQKLDDELKMIESKKEYRKTGVVKPEELQKEMDANKTARPAPPASLTQTLSKLKQDQHLWGSTLDASEESVISIPSDEDINSLLSDLKNKDNYEEARVKLLEEKRKLQEELEKIKQEEENEKVEDEITREVKANLEKAKAWEIERKKQMTELESEFEKGEEGWKSKRQQVRSPRLVKLIQEGTHITFILPEDQAKLEDEEEDEEVDACVVCGKTDNLIHCVGVCGRSIHKACRPEGEGDDWTCSDCESAAQACIFCGLTDNLLNCSGPSCERSAHKNCLNANDLKNGVWLCFDCVPTN